VFAPLDFRPESADVDIYCPVPAVVVVAPDLIEQGLAGEDPAAVGGEECQEFVFREGEGEGLTIERHFPSSEVDHQRSVSDEVFAINRVRLLQGLFDSEGHF